MSQVAKRFKKIVIKEILIKKIVIIENIYIYIYKLKKELWWLKKIVIIEKKNVKKIIIKKLW